jgi:hypothetical protein
MAGNYHIIVISVESNFWSQNLKCDEGLRRNFIGDIYGSVIKSIHYILPEKSLTYLLQITRKTWST